MAQFSMPWEPYVGDGKVYTSAEWRRAWQIMHLPRYSTDGVLYSGGGSDALLPITVGVDTFTIGVGSAMVLGSVYYNDAPVSFSSPSPTVGRIDRIVLQKDWKAGTTRLAYRVGSSATPPAQDLTSWSSRPFSARTPESTSRPCTSSSYRTHPTPSRWSGS